MYLFVNLRKIIHTLLTRIKLINQLGQRNNGMNFKNYKIVYVLTTYNNPCQSCVRDIYCMWMKTKIQRMVLHTWVESRYNGSQRPESSKRYLSIQGSFIENELKCSALLLQNAESFIFIILIHFAI